MQVPGLGPDQSDYNQSWRWSRLHTTLAQITRITPKWVCTEYTILKNFSPFHDFWATCAYSEKQNLPWNISLYWVYFVHSGFLSNLRLPWKVALKYFTVLKIFTIQDFWATCTCPEFTVLNIYFLLFRDFEQFALALKTEFALKIFKPGGLPSPRLVRLWLRPLSD